MAVHASHAALPYPIKNARYSLLVPYLDADGDPTAPTTPDTEISKDNAAAADCAEEVSATSGMDGMGLLTLSGAETDCSTVALNAKVASGPKATLAALFPRVLAIVGSGTLSAGSAGGGTLGTLLAYDVTGCFIRTTGGTGGGGTGVANNQARKIITYNTGTGAFTVAPNWETTPSTDSTYDVLLPEGVTLGMLRTFADGKLVAGAIVEASFAADTDKYQFKLWVIDDDAAGTPADRYMLNVFKNGVPVSAPGLTVTISVTGADETALFSGQTMTETAASTGKYRYVATGGARMVDGAVYIATISATIGGSGRTWQQPIGRDS
jgi:hypothetical protein